MYFFTYCTTQNSGGVIFLTNQSFQSFGKEKNWQFKQLTFSYCGESEMGKVLVNDICFVNFTTKTSPTRILCYIALTILDEVT